MKRIQTYLAGTLLLASVLGTSSAFAQTDTTRRDTTRRDSSMNRRSNNPARSDDMRYTYIDLNTGDTLDYFYDTDKKTVMNRSTNLPVDLYVNTYTGDTVYGRGRFVVNGLLVHGDNGKWKLDENKVKMEGNELKIKDGSRKLKIEGDKIKIKDGDAKAKSNDEKMKVKDEQGKAKYDEKGLKVKDKEKKRSDTLRIQQ